MLVLVLFQTWCLVCTYSTSQLGKVTFQELSNLLAAMLNDSSPSLK